MEKTLTEKIREQNESIYKVTAEKFGVTYKYVWVLARGTRSGSRGKGKLIKEYLEKQLKNK